MQRQCPLNNIFFFSCLLKVDLVFWPGLCDRFLSQNPRFLLLIFQNWFYPIHITFVYMVELQSLAQFTEYHLSTQSCLLLYSFCVSLLHLLIMWFTIFSLFPTHSLLFSRFLSILTLCYSLVLCYSNPYI